MWHLREGLENAKMVSHSTIDLTESERAKPTTSLLTSLKGAKQRGLISSVNAHTDWDSETTHPKPKPRTYREIPRTATVARRTLK